MKLTISPFWPILIVTLGSCAYGWRGAFWSVVGFFAAFLLLLVVTKLEAYDRVRSGKGEG